MNRTNWSIVVVLAIVLTGCATAQQQQADAAAREARWRMLYTNDCDRAGYQERTPAHDRCIYSAAMRDQDARAASAAALYLQMQNQKPAANPYYIDPNLLRTKPLTLPPPPVTCSSRPDGLGGWRTICE